MSSEEQLTAQLATAQQTIANLEAQLAASTGRFSQATAHVAALAQLVADAAAAGAAAAGAAGAAAGAAGAAGGEAGALPVPPEAATMQAHWFEEERAQQRRGQVAAEQRREQQREEAEADRSARRATIKLAKQKSLLEGERKAAAKFVRRAMSDPQLIPQLAAAAMLHNVGVQLGIVAPVGASSTTARTFAEGCTALGLKGELQACSNADDVFALLLETEQAMGARAETAARAERSRQPEKERKERKERPKGRKKFLNRSRSDTGSDSGTDSGSD